MNVTSINAAGNDQKVVDHLIAAHGLTEDVILKMLIEAALLHEGKKIAASVPREAFADEMDETGT